MNKNIYLWVFKYYRNKNWLKNQYINEKHSLGFISNKCFVSKSVIAYWMNKFSIEKRYPVSRIIDNKKQCNICNKILGLDNYWKKKNSIDGYYHRCISCEKESREEASLAYRSRPEIKERNKKRSSQWDIENRERKNERVRKYKHKVHNEVWYKINNNMRSSICHSLRGKKNGQHWQTLVGYTAKDLREHIESQWEEWMNWDNWGVISKTKQTWNIDHIIPSSNFNIIDQYCDDFKQCWALENLRPLDAFENVSKGNKLLGEQ